MTGDEAKELQKQWGDKPCNHPDIIEQAETESTANVKWICVQCGSVVNFDEWRRTHKGL